MLKIILKKRLYKKTFFSKLSNLYDKYLLDFYFLTKTTLYRTVFENFIPKRQHFVSVTNQSDRRLFSSGLVLAAQSVNLKYYKKSIKSNATLILYLQTVYRGDLKHLYLYRCLNFNYRQWLFLQKFWVLLNPEILYLQNKKSYNTNRSPIKSIKKRVVKMLSKQV
jgi:hypothetical protein